MDTSSVLSLITQATPNDGLDVRLLASAIVPGEPISADSLVEVTFPGYEALRPDSWSELVPPGDDGASLQSPITRVDRVETGTPATIVAYAITADTEDGRRLVSAANLGVPITLTDAGDGFRFRTTVSVVVVPPLTEGDDGREVVTSCFEQLPLRS